MKVWKRPPTVYAQCILLTVVVVLLLWAAGNGLNEPLLPLVFAVVYGTLIPLLLWGKTPGFWIAFVILAASPIVALFHLDLGSAFLGVLLMYPLVQPATLDYCGVKAPWLRKLCRWLTPPGRRYLSENEDAWSSDDPSDPEP